MTVSDEQGTSAPGLELAIAELAMAEIPAADRSWIDAAAERFERGWTNGERPRIEDLLIDVPEPRRPPLLDVLVRIEGALRRRAGEEPGAEEYCRRFPEHASAIAAIFESRPGDTTVGGQAESDRATRATPEPRPPAGSPSHELADHPDYEIVRELGVGGMGVVYLARNRLLARHEVLKVIGPHIVEQPGALERFLREVRAVARLRHPNIVSAYSAFRCGGGLVFAMEYVEGLDLRRVVKAKGPMPVGNACVYVHQAALALQHAHEEGMVHRDIKPANLMLSRHRDRAMIKVLDFGLSKAASEQNAGEPTIGASALAVDFGAHLTRTGDMLGTPDFIAPEQIVDSQKADIRADIYSLGCTLYFLLSGQPPYPDRDLRHILEAHRSLEARPLGEVRAEIPAELATLVARMMAKDPAGRFQEPAELAEALEPFSKRAGVAGGGAAPDAHRAGRAAAGKSWDATRPGSILEGLIDFSERDPLYATSLDVGRPAASPKIVRPGHPARMATAGTMRRLGSRGRWALVGVSLSVLLAALPAVIVKVRTPGGVIVLENVPANAVVEVDGDPVTVGPITGQPLTIRGLVGKHVVVVKLGDDVLLGESVSLGSDKPLRLAVRPAPRVAQGASKAGAGDQPTRPEDPRPPISAKVEPDTIAPTSPTTALSQGDRDTTEPPAPPALETEVRHVFRLATNGLGGTRFIDPVSFGPDILGFNKEPASNSPWVAAEFARFSTRGALGYPRLPASRYVFEVDLTVNQPPEDISLQLGDPLNACHISFHWQPKRRVIECSLNDWRHYVAIVGKSRDFALGERINLKLAVGDGRQTLFHEGAPISSASCWPTDCSLRIWSQTPDSAVIHHCSLRPLTRQDVAACGWPIPPSRLSLDSREAAARLGSLFAGYATRPKAGRRFAVKTTRTPMGWVPPGAFEMGSRDPNDHRRHRVRLTKGYWMAQIEVTQGEYAKVTGANPSRVTGSPYLPVDWVAWDEAAAYCRKLNELERQTDRPAGYEYRLPTEAAWEYACRAGSERDFSVPEEWVWSRDRGDDRPHEVAESQPNAWGFYDMHGNAMEWCLDAWSEYPDGTADVTVDPFKIGRPNTETTFVVRGGAWWLGLGECTSHWRSRNLNNPNGFRGFRIVLGPEIRDAKVKNEVPSVPGIVEPSDPRGADLK